MLRLEPMFVDVLQRERQLEFVKGKPSNGVLCFVYTGTDIDRCQCTLRRGNTVALKIDRHNVDNNTNKLGALRIAHRGHCQILSNMSQTTHPGRMRRCLVPNVST